MNAATANYMTGADITGSLSAMMTVYYGNCGAAGTLASYSDISNTGTIPHSDIYTEHNTVQFSRDYCPQLGRGGGAGLYKIRMLQQSTTQ